jgi:16S rRNA processing protein RimM
MDYVQIGHTQKTHGVGGELKIMIEPAYTEDFLKNSRLFLEQKGAKIPYFIEEIRGSDDNIIKFEDVNTKEEAIALQSRGVFLRREDLIPDDEREMEIEEEDDLEYGFLVGFQIHDLNLGNIGAIEEVLEMPQQEMAALHYQGRYTLIPLHPDMILQIDEEKQVIRMDLPDGLV